MSSLNMTTIPEFLIRRFKELGLHQQILSYSIMFLQMLQSYRCLRFCHLNILLPI